MIDPETTAALKDYGPYAMAAVTLLLQVVGYGRLQKSAETSEKQITQLSTDGARLLEQLNKATGSIRGELHDSLAALQKELTDKFGALNREIGEVRGGMEGERNRINNHNIGAGAQQVKNAEFYAAEAKAALETIERLAKALVEKEKGERA